jgi:NTP pyrophosphatase (non-canonical NTP hydrolase)
MSSVTCCSRWCSTRSSVGAGTCSAFDEHRARPWPTKLLRRHPHVFADGEIEGVVEGDGQRDEVKRSGRRSRPRSAPARQQHGALDDVPLALPALPRAQKLQKRAARVGFDWPDDARGCCAKLDEELQELRTRCRRRSAAVEEELGDLMFTLVNLSRHLKVDAESALRGRAASSSGAFAPWSALPQRRASRWRISTRQSAGGAGRRRQDDAGHCRENKGGARRLCQSACRM